ncbi:Uu.00g100510.m01.CDS01 [Anthostomella pinea]|uniref:Uu.00g100510.m01.CDS01 n=1 Tax=Anthostomella pinea TaxID=933095 RepID=A0AAI8VD25_9PEZI|nr:Uu.00g100510.m01.CDS01 [Anthostomella pinea]
MDPVSAIGLVSSIITIVDTSCEAVQLYREIRETGSIRANKDREDIARWLGNGADALAARIRSTAEPVSSENREFLQISEACCDTAKALSKEIHRLQDTKKPAVLKLAASIWSSRKIAKIESQLEHYSNVLDSTILRRLDSESVMQLHNFEDLNLKTQQLSIAVSTGFQTVDQLRPKLLADMENATQIITKHQEDQAQQMRDVFIRQEVQNRAIAARESNIKSLLGSLFFAEIFAREEVIAEPDETSCSFIFSAKWDDKRHRIDETGASLFADWLQSSQSLFWLTGKAGTGKSVIMKYVHAHKTTLENLTLWASQSSASQSSRTGLTTSDVIILRHFFWKPGSDLQRSPKGFLQSLLWPLLKKSTRILGCRTEIDALPSL